MTVSLTPEVDWIGECLTLGDGTRHVHVSLYLIRGDEGNLVVDSGSFYHRDSITTRLTEATAGRGVQALVLSHSDYPHSANIGAFREIWGDFEIVASCGEASIQGLPYARRSRIGGSLDVLGRELHFLDPPLADRSHTSWIYDARSRVIFAADGFGNHHGTGECALPWSEIPTGLRTEDIHAFHRDTLLWLRYVDPRRLVDALREMLERFPTDWVAPIHGNPIPGGALDDYLVRLEASATLISSGWQVPG